MKNLTIFITFIIFSFKGYSSTITAINNGAWSNASNWSSNATPASGDNVIIPAGKSIQINSNMNISTTVFYIQIYGTLQLTGGGAKLTIAAASTIYVYSGGQITGTGNPSETISIGTNQVYNAGTLNSVAGPSYANSSTPGFLPFTPLPVKFISLTVSAMDKDVLVKWATAQETGADKYEIERSYDGSNWNTIAYVLAAGTTDNVTEYSYTDKNVSEKVAYYRIRQVDTNGAFTYTEVKTVKPIVSVSTNNIVVTAADHKIMLIFNKEVKTTVVVRFISFGGQVVSQQYISQPSGQVTLNANASLRGNYIISITNGADVNTAKQVIL